VKAKFIIEAANHPTDPDADEVRILICCDVVCIVKAYPILQPIWNCFLLEHQPCFKKKKKRYEKCKQKMRLTNCTYVSNCKQAAVIFYDSSLSL